MQTPNVPTKK